MNITYRELALKGEVNVHTICILDGKVAEPLGKTFFYLNIAPIIEGNTNWTLVYTLDRDDALRTSGQR